MLYAATAPGVVQGGYYGPRFGLIGAPAVAKVSRLGQDQHVAARLWADAERLTGVTIPPVN